MSAEQGRTQPGQAACRARRQTGRRPRSRRGRAALGRRRPVSLRHPLAARRPGQRRPAGAHAGRDAARHGGAQLPRSQRPGRARARRRLPAHLLRALREQGRLLPRRLRHAPPTACASASSTAAAAEDGESWRERLRLGLEELLRFVSRGARRGDVADRRRPRRLPRRPGAPRRAARPLRRLHRQPGSRGSLQPTPHPRRSPRPASSAASRHLLYTRLNRGETEDLDSLLPLADVLRRAALRGPRGRQRGARGSCRLRSPLDCQPHDSANALPVKRHVERLFGPHAVLEGLHLDLGGGTVTVPPTIA